MATATRTATAIRTATGTHELPGLDLWGGIECTVNRVGDLYFDQLERNGHARRIDDLELVAGLGIRTIRYPVLWERIAPDGLDRADWSWADERLGRLRSLGIRPIVGLVHHGSGPRCTSLIDPEFPEKLAAFARAFAERYPWVDMYTPVNEPLTTARFSGLYGLWYPHGRDNETFGRAMIGQCRGIALAMQEIRRVNRAARLVQTEDLGKIHSTPLLAYQAAFENERRWLTLDLLCGRVAPGHPMYELYFDTPLVDEAEIAWLRENPTAPDIVGVNHYLTSERFLDENLEHYPEGTHGGNGRHEYADVEAVRVMAGGAAGPRALMLELWRRYGLPIAVTEAHLGCTREEQLRWMHEIWHAADSLRAEGVDVRAVTAWSLLGAYDWSSLLTRDNGHYEPGAFDLRSERPRRTAIATMLHDLARKGRFEHPLLAGHGWWRRPARLTFGRGHEHPEHEGSASPPLQSHRRRPLIITGATGTLGRAFARICAMRGIEHRLLSRAELDIADGDSVERALDMLQPWAVINTAGYVRVDDAEDEPERCRRENTTGTELLAGRCAAKGIALATFSSDLVFDGTKGSPYLESDETAPLNEYGRSKVLAERLVLAAHPGALVVRTAAFFGAWDSHNFVASVLRALEAGESFIAANDTVVSPTYIPDLVHTTLDLLIDGESGIWHLANRGAITWADLARRVAELAGLDPTAIIGVGTPMLALAARRPAAVPLASERGEVMPTLENALARCMAALYPADVEVLIDLDRRDLDLDEC